MCVGIYCAHSCVLDLGTSPPSNFLSKDLQRFISPPYPTSWLLTSLLGVFPRLLGWLWFHVSQGVMVLRTVLEPMLLVPDSDNDVIIELLWQCDNPSTVSLGHTVSSQPPPMMLCGSQCTEFSNLLHQVLCTHSTACSDEFCFLCTTTVVSPLWEEDTFLSFFIL
jgi:hypothetical protein